MKEFMLNKVLSGILFLFVINWLSPCFISPFSWQILLPLKPMRFSHVDRKRKGANEVYNYFLQIGIVLF